MESSKTKNNQENRLVVWTENWCCPVMFLVGIVMCWRFAGTPFSDDDQEFYIGLMGTFATVSSVLAGLLSAAGAHFTTHTDNWLNDILKQQGMHTRIMRYYRTASILGASATCMSLLLIFLIKKYPDEALTKWLLRLFSGIAAAGGAAYLRSLEIFNMVIKVMEQKEEAAREDLEFYRQDLERRRKRAAERPDDYDEGDW
jgi:cytochrome bd-type quinol oxidase subunit 2